jgi:GH25 family lysozyme M1 (1,4-beta-N-acetylmuramidase)
MGLVAGIDVSSIQNSAYAHKGSGPGTLPWGALQLRGVKFAYLRCGVGNDAPDACFQKNVLDGKPSMALGAYHFVYPLPHIDPRDQANKFIDLCGGHLTLPTMLDLEWPLSSLFTKWGCTSEQILDWTLACLDQYSSQTKRKAGLYTYPSFWQGLGGAARTEFSQYPLWCASYVNSGICPFPKDTDVPPHNWAPWAGWTVWQYTGGGVTMPGGVPCDGDVMQQETLDELSLDYLRSPLKGNSDSHAA